MKVQLHKISVHSKSTQNSLYTEKSQFITKVHKIHQQTVVFIIDNLLFNEKKIPFHLGEQILVENE